MKAPGRLLAPFDLSGRATLNVGGIAVEDMETKIGDATISGSFSWTGAGKDSTLRKMRTDLKADKVDFVQVKALAELLAGKDLSDTSALADSYEIKLAADELAIADITMRDVSVDASFVDGTLTVSGVDIGDIGGAHVIVTRGKIDNVLTEPKGRLEAQFNAQTVTGLAARHRWAVSRHRFFALVDPSGAVACAGSDVDRDRLRVRSPRRVVAADRQGIGGGNEFRRDDRPGRFADGLAERERSS